jgi:D-galactarolactone cycloisomerase
VKITAVDTYLLRAPLSEPRGPSILSYRERQTLVIKVTTDAGLVGWGETIALGGVRGAITDVIARLLVGRDPLEVRKLWREMSAATFENGFAVGGVDIALHDIWGKALGVPVHQLYGGAQRTHVPAYASLPGYIEGRRPADHWVREVDELAEQGYRAMKLRIGRFSPEEELPVIAEVRKALPAGSRLMADGNAAYTLGTAVAVGQELARLGLAWFEEPLSQFGYHGYEELRSKLTLPLAGGEGLQTRHAFAGLLERGCVDIVQPDVSICGGITECLFVADLAALTGVRCIPHCWGGAITLAATLHVVSLLPDPSRLPGNEAPMLEYDVTENPFRTQLPTQPIEIQSDGNVAVPDGPGLGIEIDERAFERFAVRA